MCHPYWCIVVYSLSSCLIVWIVNIERICSIICPFVHCDKKGEKLCGSSKRGWLLKVELIFFFLHVYNLLLQSLIYLWLNGMDFIFFNVMLLMSLLVLLENKYLFLQGLSFLARSWFYVRLGWFSFCSCDVKLFPCCNLGFCHWMAK